MALRYNRGMDGYNFFHPIEIRYGDLDPQGHVNNARYLTYFEQARISYIQHLGLWTPGDFSKIGIILASVRVDFRAPVLFGQDVHAAVRVTRLGNKSLDMEYRLVDAANGEVLAEAASVLVAYEYQTARTIPIPSEWRSTITAFERLPV